MLTLGHRGKSYEVRTLWLENLGIWMAADWQGPHYRHIFGITAPNHIRRLAVTCEINFPRRGIERKVGGAFARDAEGRVYVVHRGLLGGRKGVGKGIFMREYRGIWAEMEEGEKVSSVVVVGNLTSVRFPRQVAQFVKQVAEIKEKEESVDTRQLSMPLELNYTPEIFGLETYGEAKRNLSSACDLGLAIQDLIREMESRGAKVRTLGPNCLSCSVGLKERDVYFFVIPDSGNRSIREGAINLFFLALRSRRPYRLVLVLPDGIDNLLKERLGEFSIETLVFHWNKDRACFESLDL